jgi:polysaccharide transporter, PST family
MGNSDRSAHGAFSDSVDAGDGLRKKSVRGAVFMASAGAAESVVRLAATVGLARLLSPEELGLVAMVMVLIGLVEFVKDLGLGIVTVQDKDITHREVSSLFWVNSILGVGFVALLCALSPVISAFYGDGRLIAITLSLSSTVLLSAISVQPEALLSRQMRQGQIALARLVSTSLSSLIAIACAIAGLGYWSLVIREISRSALFLAWIWWYSAWLPSMILRFKEVSRHLKDGLNLSMSFFLTAVIRQIDGILVGRFFGASDLGVYRQAQGLVVAPIEQFNAPVFGVAQPALSALQSDALRYQRFYQRMVAFVAMVTMPVGVFVAAYSNEFTLVLLGPKWSAAAPFVCVFALAMALRPTIQTCTMVVVTLGRSKSLLAQEIAYSLIYALFVIAAIHLSALSVAIAFVAATVAFSPIRIFLSFRNSPVTLGAMFAAVRLALISSALMYATLFAFRSSLTIHSPLNALLSGIAVGAASYALPWLVLPSGRADLRQIVHDIYHAMRRKKSTA